MKDAEAPGMPAELLRLTIGSRLRADMPDIVRSIFQEARTSAPDAVGDDPEYESGLLDGIADAVAYCIQAIERGDQEDAPLPRSTLDQARLAAQHGVVVETIVRRVALGERTILAYATREAGNLPARELNLVSNSLGPAVDRLVRSLIKAHQQERERLNKGPYGRRIDLIERLLAGGQISRSDDAVLEYPLSGWHLGLIGTGTDVESLFRQLAEGLRASLLFLHGGSSSASGWLGGGRRRIDYADVRRQAALHRLDQVALVVGEPGQALEGWRRTHEQAKLALLGGRSRPGTVTRAADVLPETVLSKDPVRARLLVSTYLSCLDGLRRDGAIARETLRAYFGHDRNVSATASFLGVSRGTVESRMREVEKAVGTPLRHEQLTRLELALRIEEQLSSSISN